mgnify:CR=1 FL=1
MKCGQKPVRIGFCDRVRALFEDHSEFSPWFRLTLIPVRIHLSWYDLIELSFWIHVITRVSHSSAFVEIYRFFFGEIGEEAVLWDKCGLTGADPLNRVFVAIKILAGLFVVLGIDKFIQLNKDGSGLKMI